MEHIAWGRLVIIMMMTMTVMSSVLVVVEANQDYPYNSYKRW